MEDRRRPRFDPGLRLAADASWGLRLFEQLYWSDP
jgi:hypothetical protein